MREPKKLFELIRSMSKAEKIYFKRYTSMYVKGSENNYIRLFNAFSGLEEYDEKRVRKTLKGNPELKFFSSSQSYLYKLILKCLRTYYSRESADATSAELLLDFYILRDRGLIEQSYHALERLKDLALETEDIPLVLKSCFLQENNAFRRPEIKTFSLLADEMYPLMHQQLEKLKEGIEISKLRNRAQFLYLKSGENTDDKAAVKEIQGMLQNPLLAVDRDYSTRGNLYGALGARSLLHFILGDYFSMKKINQVHLNALRRDPLFYTESHLGSYGMLLAMRISICHRLDDRREAQTIFKEIRSLKFSSAQREISIFMYAYINILGMYGDAEMTDKALGLIPEIARKLKKYGAKISEEGRRIFYLNISVVHFLAEDYKSALKWINSALNSWGENIRQDSLIGAKVLNILIHYELNNFQLIDSLVVSLRRFLIKHNKGNPFYKTFLRLIKRLYYVRDKKEQRERFAHLIKECENIEGGDKERIFILKWLEKKYRQYE